MKLLLTLWCLAAVPAFVAPAAVKMKKSNSFQVETPLKTAAVNRILHTEKNIPSSMKLNRTSEISPRSSPNERSEIDGASNSATREEPLGNFVINAASVQRTFNETARFYLPVPRLRRAKNLSWESEISSANLSERCELDVRAIYQAFENSLASIREAETLQSSTFWAFQMFDSWGKSGDGLLYGDRQWLGFMEQCLATTGYTKTSQFTGQYCWIFTGRNGSEEDKALLPSSYGTCMPSSCSQEELWASLTEQLAEFHYVAADVQCQQKDEPEHDVTWIIIGCAVIGALTLPVVVATIAQIFRDELPGVVKAFSFIENWKKITAIRQKAPGEISCIHCIRVLSISWVMLSHQYFFIGPRGDNPIKMKLMSQDWAFQMVWSGYKAVDTFFTIGGLLTAIVLMKKDFCLERPNKPNRTPDAKLEPNMRLKALPPSKYELDKRAVEGGNSRTLEELSSRDPSDWQVIKQQGVVKTLCVFFTRYAFYVLHRIFRITPAIVVVVMICAGPSALFVRGVFKKLFEKNYLVECRKDWWVDLSMAANILSAPQGFPYGNNETDSNIRGCIGSTWYLGVDFQVYLVAPFLILPAKMLGRYKWLYSAGVALAFCLVAGIVTVAEDLLPASLMTFDKQAVVDYTQYFYLMPYTRVAPYFVGAFFGLLLVDVDVAVKSGNLEGPRWLRMLRKKEVLVLGWTAFTATCLAVVFGLANINYYSLVNPRPELSPAATFMYASFDSAAWACCIGWIVLTCSFGLAGPVDEFLSHPIWQVPSRVTYSVYLISLPLQGFIFYSGYRLIHLSHLTLLLGYGGVVALSFLTGSLISFVGEAPYVALGKIIMGRS